MSMIIRAFAPFMALLTWNVAVGDAFAVPACELHLDAGVFNVCSDEFARSGNAVVDASPESDSEAPVIRVVKFDAPISVEQQEALDRTAERLDYLPHFAYVVRVPAGSVRPLTRLPGVVWLGKFSPEWRIGLDVQSALTGGAGSTIGLSVSLWPGGSALDLKSELAGLDESVSGIQWIPGLRERLHFTVPNAGLENVVQHMASQDAVAAIQLRRDVQFFNSRGGWLHQSGETEKLPIFEQGLFGCGQTIGVLDSGVDFGHCAFVDPLVPFPPIIDCALGANCEAGAADPSQRVTSIYYKWSGSRNALGDAACNPATGAGHGTHVAATAVGNTVDNPIRCDAQEWSGEPGDFDGAAPGARLVAQEMGEDLAYVNTLGGSLSHAVEIAYLNGARIHNNSWGAPCRRRDGSCIPGCTNYNFLTRNADEAAWRFPDMSIFVAAGNDGSFCQESVGSPGNAKNVLSIGSTLPGLAADDMSGFSSRGPIADGRTKPDLVAQGSSIRSAASLGTAGQLSCGSCVMSGTSMASPAVAGLAALVREYFERGFYPSGSPTAGSELNPSAALVRSVLVNSGRHLAGDGGGPGPNQNQGWGRVTLNDSLYFEGDDRQLWISDNRSGLTTGEYSEYVLEVGLAEPLKVTLSWTDHPAALNAAIHLVNQLRLELVTPSGQTWTQKLEGGPNPSQGMAAGNYDNRNNVHQITLSAPEPGSYRLRVRAIHVPMGGRQPYAVVASGRLSGVNEPMFNLAVAEDRLDVCAGDAAEFDLLLGSVLEFDQPIRLSVRGEVADQFDNALSPNPVVPSTPPATSRLTLQTPTEAPAGRYSGHITAFPAAPEIPDLLREAAFELHLARGVSSAPVLQEPGNQVAEVPVRPVLRWVPLPGASRYRLQLSADRGFVDPQLDLVLEDTELLLPEPLSPRNRYYWRVAALNACGQGDFGLVRSFTTALEICSSPNSAIPLGGSVIDELSLDQLGRLMDLQVALDLDFSWPGDLVVQLEHIPSATSVALLNRPGVPAGPFNDGCDTDNVSVLFRDGAPSAQDIANCSEAPPGLQGILGPAEPLTSFSGLSMDGPWRLTASIAQELEPAPGTLGRWCLIPRPAIDELFQDGFETTTPE